ncbi:MAG: hypothetical protein H6736_22635 [Alphaproteobacteria bacterium]|nr:hypothetical protein [Alphaproteobacteria bacterium]MCB9694617.1 hypothetical protein [Alphaproteobacteria bacterium]
MSSLEDVQGLWFDGDAWCKAARLDDRSDPAGRPGQQRMAEAVDAWRRSRDAVSADQVRALLVDDLLCEQMPESSWFAEYERGPWVRCSRAEALKIARGLVADQGCEAAEQALAWFEGFVGGAGACLRFGGDIRATFALDGEAGAFFFDVG